ncbi:MAG TPA: cytochrome c3 family protein [Polyangiaceae bacterium]
MVLTMVAFLSYSLTGETRTVYLPGPTTVGHYQIELECKACHSEVFTDRAALQAACVKCHGGELKRVNDSHPEAKFTDPRNASRVEELDARYCMTCHREHRPEVTSSMGLSVPQDYCFRCHETVAEERATHQGLAFDSCQDAGCHNFHDNEALYEDFLAKHYGEPALLPSPQRPGLTHARSAPLTERDADAPAWFVLGPAQAKAWAASGHGQAGTNCSACHASKDGQWQASVPGERCGECHAAEREGYLAGRHGMREAAGLGPMRVGDARQPMRDEAKDETLSCTSCHGAHAFDTREAAISACLGCHDDRHSTSYRQSKHYAVFRADESGRSGASCATCHLPRIGGEAGEVRVVHNQNDTLRPNEKMVRGVCINCHGLQFSLDALADRELIAKNFGGAPAAKVESLEWAWRRVR